MTKISHQRAIVDTMRDAYDRISVREHGFGGFISGSSRTPDIEQSLVMGAHGAMAALVIALLAVPILIQVYFNAMLAYWLNKKLGVAHCVAGPSALIGASNFFELAVATAIALFGFESGAALATVVGVLIEVPAMLSVVAIVNRSRHWYEQR